ncbi:MAG: HlyC/CorC family transporter [Anaerolineales bacterium]|nr:HlyC/CorC family transporter [Anaerolineales bacterium]
MLLEILIILLLLALNGVFAMAEIAVISARSARLQQHAEEDDAGAQAALELKANPNNFLSSVQIGITLIGILAGAFGGATLADELAGVLAFLPIPESWTQTMSVGLVVVAITYLSLVIGELAPKRLALNDPERIAALVSRPMRLLAQLTRPVVFILARSTDLVVCLLGSRASGEQPVTKEEIQIMIEQGTQVGVFEPIEEQIVDKIFQLDELPISVLTTPRPDVLWLDITDPPAIVREKVMACPHTRIPVARDSLDDVLGLVHVNDLLTQCLNDEPIDLGAAMHPPLYLPGTTPVYIALERFKEHRSQVALVIDEYGGLKGLVTGDDILEAIVGEIQEFDEAAEPQIVRRPDGSWLVDGLYAFDELQERFDIADVPEIEERYYRTLGGFVMACLGRVPTAGDHFTWGDLRFEIVDMDGRRVDKILLTTLDEPDEHTT